MREVHAEDAAGLTRRLAKLDAQLQVRRIRWNCPCRWGCHVHVKGFRCGGRRRPAMPSRQAGRTAACV